MAANCVCCGTGLTGANSWPMPVKIGGNVPYCPKCQQKIFAWLSNAVGQKIAFVICCAMFNIPFQKQFLQEAFDNRKPAGGWWASYIRSITKAGLLTRGFETGETDIAKLIGVEESKDDKKISRAEEDEYTRSLKDQKEFWGKGSLDDPYTPEQYNALDRYYDALTAERPFRNPQSEMAIQKICRWQVEQDRCVEEKNYADAQKIGSLIKTEMESEQLRKKDELPQDVTRIDDIVLALNRKGLHLMDYDELCTELANHAFHSKYPYTRDAADQMLLFIRNTTAYNEGRSEVASLPPEFAITDELDEFASEPDTTQKQIYNDLQIAPLNMDKKGKNNGGK